MAVDGGRADTTTQWAPRVLGELRRVIAESGLTFAPKARRFWFLRHGRTVSNVSGLIQGNTDIALDEIGCAQASLAGRILCQASVTGIFASDLSRAKETARLAGIEIGIGEISLEPRLRERSFGTLGGTAKVHDAWLSDSAEVEGLEPFARRTLTGISATLDRPDILVCAHGGNLRVLEAVLGIALTEGHYANARPIRFEHLDSGWVCSVLDDEQCDREG